MPIEPKDFEQFMNQVRMKLPGSSDAGIKSELYDVIDEFCVDTLAWREQLVINVLPGVQINTNVTSTPDTPLYTNMTYALIPAEGGMIIELLGVFDPNQVAQPALLPTGSGGDKSVGLLTLLNPVNTPQPFTVQVAKTVVLPTTSNAVPIFSHALFRRNHRYFLDGVLGKMMGEQAKTYSNDTLSTYHLKRFRDGIAMAQVEAQRQNTMGAQAWRFPRGWSTRGQRGGVSTANPTQF